MVCSLLSFSFSLRERNLYLRESIGGFKVYANDGCVMYRVLESIKAGKRLSEARFAMNIAGRGQRSVLAFV